MLISFRGSEPSCLSVNGSQKPVGYTQVWVAVFICSFTDKWEQPWLRRNWKKIPWAASYYRTRVVMQVKRILAKCWLRACCIVYKLFLPSYGMWPVGQLLPTRPLLYWQMTASQVNIQCLVTHYTYTQALHKRWGVGRKFKEIRQVISRGCSKGEPDQLHQSNQGLS